MLFELLKYKFDFYLNKSKYIKIYMGELSLLDIRQLNILEDFINGKNIFMSGPGGTGKSYLINIIKEICLKTHKDYQVTALTGCAALLLNAKTLHSWSGTGIIESSDVTYYVNKIRKSKKITNWTEIDLLIVDEVSMLSKKLFDILDAIGKKFRKNDKPFGGIQLIFSGDFYQLPPVCKGDDRENSLYCFQSKKWDETFPTTHILTKIFRQDNKIFSKMLNNIRVGKISNNNVETLKSRIIPFENNDIIPTKLFPKNKEVDSINNFEHGKLKTPGKIFNIRIINPSDEEIFENHISEYDIKHATELIKKNNQSIEIKVGDQVICTYNISDTIVNGSRGVVTGMNEYPIVKFVDNIELEMKPIDLRDPNVPGLICKKIPLEYAWALTIHKCQGMTLDLCVMDLGKGIFEAGQVYVALSRVKSLEGLYLLDFDPNGIITKTKVKQFYEKYSLNTYTKEQRKSEKKRIIKLINNYIELNKNNKKPEKVINKDILEKIKEYRLKIAKEKNIPCYRILTNETIINIASNIPKDNSDLLSIKGIGKKTLELYGEDILRIIDSENL
jgi:ATP-dependent DNA helicase PIF1